MKGHIPLYDICHIDQSVHPDLLVDRLRLYLEKHYAHLHRPHRHTFYHLVLFVSGKGRHTIDFEEFIVRPFQIYFMAPGQVHSWHFEEPMEGYIVHFNADLFSSFLYRADYIQRYPFLQGNSNDAVFNLTDGTKERVQELFESMLEETALAHSNVDMIRLLLLEVFIYVERSCTSKATSRDAEHKLQMVSQFRQLVQTHFRSIRLPKDYAQLMYITPNYLNALCQDVLGVTAGEVIRDRVLLEAKRMLTNSQVDVAEIAYQLNFHDNSYFTRFFKKNTGITPEQFRTQISLKT